MHDLLLFLVKKPDFNRLYSINYTHRYIHKALLFSHSHQHSHADMLEENTLNGEIPKTVPYLLDILIKLYMHTNHINTIVQESLVRQINIFSISNLSVTQ